MLLEEVARKLCFIKFCCKEKVVRVNGSDFHSV